MRTHTFGHHLPFGPKRHLPFERQVQSETCRTINANNSAVAVVSARKNEWRLCRSRAADKQIRLLSVKRHEDLTPASIYGVA